MGAHSASARFTAIVRVTFEELLEASHGLFGEPGIVVTHRKDLDLGVANARVAPEIGDRQGRRRAEADLGKMDSKRGHGYTKPPRIF